MNIWPPYFFAGIQVAQIAPDYSHVRVVLRDRWVNRNYFGTHFGGSLYAMTDPFFALMLVNGLGRGYVVWDQAAKITFLRPGRGTVSVDFNVAPARLAEIRGEAESGGKVLPWFHASIVDAQGQIVANVEKQVYVRRKLPKALGV